MPKIHDLEDGRHAFRCPGCGNTHVVNDTWTFNGDYNKPTFQPSILTMSGHYSEYYNHQDCWCNWEAKYPDKGPAPFVCYRCHSFVTDGKIQFLSDCSHELAGQTVEIPDWED